MRYLERIYPWLLVAPAVLPVVVWGGVVYPYLVPKTLLFYALMFLAVGAFGILVAHGRAFYWDRLTRWEAWIPALLLALAYGTSLAGTDFYRSFWSLYIRGDGLLMLTCAVASFYLIALSADRKFFARLLSVVGVVGTSVALYGIGEWLTGGGRIGSLLGNAAFFAGYLGIAFFALLALAPSLTGGWRRLAYIGAGVQVVAIILTATRGTILALAVAGSVALVYLAVREKGKLRTSAVGSLLTIAVLGGLFMTFRSSLAELPFEPIARIAGISASETDVASRLFIWEHMLAEIGERPWTGVGAEHINVLFNRFYDPTQIVEQWFDRSHNTFLDYAAQYGIFGLLLYLAFLVAFLTTALRLLRKGDRRHAGVLALLAVTYAAQNFFVFDTVSSFWLALALLSASFAASHADGAPRPLPLPASARYVSWVAAFALVLLLIPVSVRPFQAAYAIAHAYTYQLTDVAKEVDYLSHGFALDTYGNLEYGYIAYDMYGNTQAHTLTGEPLIAAYQAALSVLTENFNRYPYDARTALYLSHVLSLAPDSVAVNQDLLSASLERAIRLSPKRAQPWYILTNLSLSQANGYPAGSSARAAGYAAARDILSRYIELVPMLSQPRYVLAQLEYAFGNQEAAAASAAEGKRYYTEDIETARRATSYYSTQGDLENLEFFLSDIHKIDPTDYASAYDLAKIKFLLGEKEEARALFNQVRTADPALLDTDPAFKAAMDEYER